MKRPLFTAPLLLVALAGASFPPAPVRADAADDAYQQASQFYNAHLYTTAAQALKKFLDANPANPNAKMAAYQWAGALYRAENGNAGVDYPAAIAAYRWALKQYPTAPANIVAAARFELGEALYITKKPAECVAALTEFLKNPGTDAQAPTRAGWANYYLGKSYEDLKKPALSRAAYETVRTKYGATEAAPDALLELGLINLDAGQNAAAISLFTHLRTQFPASDAAPEAQVRLGEAQLNAKNYAGARDTLHAALADPKAADFKTDVLQDLADTDFAEKKWDDAARSYALLQQNVSATDARAVNAQLQRGNAFFNAKNWAAALESYAPLLRTKSAATPSAIYFSAGSLSGQGKFAEAAALYRQFLAAYPKNDLAPKAALRLGDALADAKDPAGAAQAYKTVLTRYPGPEAKAAQAALTDLAGTAGASEAVESALRDLPASAVGNAKLRLAQAAYERGDFVKSAQLAATVSASKPDAATAENALYLVGSATLSAKDPAGAAAAFNNQVTAFPKGKLASQGYLGLAWALQDEKKWDASAQAASKAVATGGEKDRAQLALGTALMNQAKYAPAVLAFGIAEGSSDKDIAAQGAQGSALTLEKQKLWAQAAAKWGKRASLLTDGDTRARSFLRQGLALGKAKDGVKAQLAFDAAVAAAPKSDVGAQALYEGAWLAHDTKQAAIEAARWNSLETDFPTSKLTPEAILQNGELASSQKKWDDAAAAYQRMLQKFPTDELVPRANFSLGTAFYSSEKWADAAAAFDKVGASKEQFSLEAPYWAAESFRKSGNGAEAGAHYARFVKAVEGSPTAPSDLKALIPVARLNWGQSVSDPAQAVTIYRPALATATGKTKTELQFRLGEALAQQKNWADALPLLLGVATSENEWRSPAQWLAGQALENTGAKADALAIYQKLAAVTPPDQWTEKAAARLKELAP